MTLKEKIESFVGTYSDTDALDNWLTFNAKYHIDILPESKLAKLEKEKTDSGSGVSLSDYKIRRAHKSNVGATYVEPGKVSQSQNSSSIHYSISEDPSFTVKNGYAYVYPSGGTVVVVPYPIVTYGQTRIIEFPEELEQLVILRTAINCAISKSNTALTSLNGLSFSTDTVPTTPSAPSFSYTMPASDEDYTNFDSAMTDEDLELAGGHLGKVSSRLDKFSRDMQNSLNKFNEDVVEYNATLGKYQADLSAYSANINQNVQSYTSSVQRYSAEIQFNANLASQLKQEYDELFKGFINVNI